MVTRLLAFILALTIGAPAFAEESPAAEPTPTATEAPTPTPEPTATPVPTPTIEPRCEDVGPLVRCRAVQDPAAVLNQRVTGVEQGQAQFRQAVVNELTAIKAEIATLKAGKKK